MRPTPSSESTSMAPPRGAPVRFREGWLHLCNGLDPVRDGGMVPSILGMTGALAEHATPVTIVTPTPSRLGTMPLPPESIYVGRKPTSRPSSAPPKWCTCTASGRATHGVERVQRAWRRSPT